MIRDLEIRNHRFPVLLDLNIFGIIFSDGYRGVNNIGNGHHDGLDFFFYFSLLIGKTLYSLSIGCNFLFYFLCFLFLSFLHQAANHFGNLISLGS